MLRAAQEREEKKKKCNIDAGVKEARNAEREKCFIAAFRSDSAGVYHFARPRGPFAFECLSVILKSSRPPHSFFFFNITFWNLSICLAAQSFFWSKISPVLFFTFGE